MNTIDYLIAIGFRLEEDKKNCYVLLSSKNNFFLRAELFQGGRTVDIHLIVLNEYILSFDHNDEEKKQKLKKYIDEYKNI